MKLGNGNHYEIRFDVIYWTTGDSHLLSVIEKTPFAALIPQFPDLFLM
jgi:hypothetical protein